MFVRFPWVARTVAPYGTMAHMEVGTMIETLAQPRMQQKTEPHYRSHRTPVAEQHRSCPNYETWIDWFGAAIDVLAGATYELSSHLHHLTLTCPPAYLVNGIRAVGPTVMW